MALCQPRFQKSDKNPKPDLQAGHELGDLAARIRLVDRGQREMLEGTPVREHDVREEGFVEARDAFLDLGHARLHIQHDVTPDHTFGLWPLIG